ncbi:MAG: NAD(P)-dependent oxidoreductase [Luteolibacter sp.]
MRIAVTGTTGRVGAALARHLAARHEVIPLPRGICDLADTDSLTAALDSLDCDVFLNPAGLTGLEACEDDPRLAMRINSAAPGKIALWAASRGVRVIHFSTDYVFGGENTALLTEQAAPHPLSVYGRSKLAGEKAVLAHPGNLVVRVSWVFGPEKPSFIDQTFHNALAGRHLEAIADKYSLPVFTTDLATWMETLIEQKTEGILHACNPGTPVSWHGMAQVVVAEMVAAGIIDPLPEIAEQKLENVKAFRAVRPRFTAMDTARLAMETGLTLRPWPEAIKAYVRECCASFRENHP